MEGDDATLRARAETDVEPSMQPGPAPATALQRAAAVLVRLAWWLCVLSAGLALLLPLPVFYEVVMDQLQQPPIWVFELTGYAIIVIAFLASGFALKSGHHFRVTLLPDRFPALDRPLQVLAGLMEALFGLMLLAGGLEQVATAWADDTVSDTLLAVPLAWPQLAFPVGGAAILLVGVAHVLDPRRHRMHDAPHP